jgi:hypothetical protein
LLDKPSHRNVKTLTAVLAHGIQEKLSFVILYVPQADDERKGYLLKGWAMDPIVECVKHVLKSKLSNDLEHLFWSGLMVLSGSPNGIVDVGQRLLLSGDWIGLGLRLSLSVIIGDLFVTMLVQRVSIQAGEGTPTPGR